ncbi:MAG TPA: GAF and ANTAR domain-containing protein [Frankiaceae bacterium]|nr:GAF and ANTAR domain-containing protein [Frankiaceae bacterium]
MTGSLRHPAVDAALSTAATLLGMEVVFIGGLDDDTFRFDRVHGSMPGLDEGMESERTDSFCHRMLGGAPCTTADAARDDHYIDAPVREQLGIASYVGVPIRRADGAVFGTLCGIDRRNVSVDAATVGVLRELAGIIAAHLPGDDATGVVIRRTPDGWHVGETGDPGDDLTTAMVLADLLQADLDPGTRPDRGDPPADELAKLRTAVTQLEHALAARVTVEQAIGVLSERLRVPPRDAFERLRKVARRGGRRVHDLSRDVVRSATQPVDLPDELRAP